MFCKNHAPQVPAQVSADLDALVSQLRAQTQFPPSFSYDGLSILLNRSTPSLQADRSRKPWTLPPACEVPGSKSPIWLLSDVLAWLASYRQPVVQPPATPDLTPIPRRRGRPTKASQLARARTVAGGKGGV